MYVCVFCRFMLKSFCSLDGWLAGWFVHVNFLFRNRFYLIYKQNHKRIKKVIVWELNKCGARERARQRRRRQSTAVIETVTVTTTITNIITTHIINTLHYKKWHDSIGKRWETKEQKHHRKHLTFCVPWCVCACWQNHRQDKSFICI